MPALVRATLDFMRGIANLRFTYHPPTVQLVKEVPGARWDPDTKSWDVGLDAWMTILQPALPHEIVGTIAPPPMSLPQVFNDRLRPYQQQGAQFLLQRPGSLLTMDPRTGKTPTAISAGCTLMNYGQIDVVVVTAPAGVMAGWTDQLRKWANIELIRLTGYESFTREEIEDLRERRWLWIGCHFELLDKRYEDLHEILLGKRFAVIADEIQGCKNHKAGRTMALRTLAAARDGYTVVPEKLLQYRVDTPRSERKRSDSSDEKEVVMATGHCVARWALTGTPMRNRNKDLFSVLDFTNPGAFGGYWSFAKRYCDAHKGEYGWEDGGETNSDELRKRLAALSFRVTRADVAPWLPKSERVVIACKLDGKYKTLYKNIEQAYATQIKAALMNDDPTQQDRDVMKELSLATSHGKVKTGLERAHFHASRGVKVVVFAQWHQTLAMFHDALDTYRKAYLDGDEIELPPHFVAGGWHPPEKRKEIIDQWRAHNGPAILLVNTLSSGVGIDLADAEVAIFLELTWVPSDFRQAEDRIQDIHLGKRKTPPLYEYLIVKDTIDEAMAGALLHKIRSIEAVVGKDAETGNVAHVLRESGVVGAAHLGLPSTDRETVRAAINSIRDRWLKGESASKDESAEVIADLETSWDDDTPSDLGEIADDIPF